MNHSDKKYENELTTAIKAAQMAGEFIASQVGNLSKDDARDKGLHDLVTYVDEEAERLIRNHLSEAFPSYEIIGEEGHTGAINPVVDGIRWIVDPLDGTTNFMHCVPPYAVSIALQEGSELVAGVVYDVPHQELFSATGSGTLMRNGESAGVSTESDLGKSLIATGFPFRDYRFVDGYLKTFESVMQNTRGIRRHGSAAIDLAWVACGRFDGFFEAGLAPWDMAAGIVLIRAGGGMVDGLPTGTDPAFDGGIIATNGHIHQALLNHAEPLAESYQSILPVS